MTRNDLDHPCKGTCSGWQQGYERGLASNQAALDELYAAAASLMSEDDAVEALSHFNCLFILKDVLARVAEMRGESHVK